MKTKPAVSTQALHPATALYPKATYLYQALINFHTITSAMGLTVPKLVLTCVIKAMGVDLYDLNGPKFIVAVPLLACGGRGPTNKNYYYIESWSQ
jgi:hypothetical protein